LTDILTGILISILPLKITNNRIPIKDISKKYNNSLSGGIKVISIKEDMRETTIKALMIKILDNIISFNNYFVNIIRCKTYDSK
jgi:hypothetical protein